MCWMNSKWLFLGKEKCVNRKKREKLFLYFSFSTHLKKWVTTFLLFCVWFWISVCIPSQFIGRFPHIISSAYRYARGHDVSFCVSIFSFCAATVQHTKNFSLLLSCRIKNTHTNKTKQNTKKKTNQNNLWIDWLSGRLICVKRRNGNIHRIYRKLYTDLQSFVAKQMNFIIVLVELVIN